MFMMKMDAAFWIQSITIVLFGTIGALLFKLGVNQVGAINPWDMGCWVRLVFEPATFFGLLCLFLSRLLFSLPLSKTGIGKFSALIIPLNIIAIAVSSAIVFREQFGYREIAGIALGLIAITLIGSE